MDRMALLLHGLDVFHSRIALLPIPKSHSEEIRVIMLGVRVHNGMLAAFSHRPSVLQKSQILHESCKDTQRCPELIDTGFSREKKGRMHMKHQASTNHPKTPPVSNA